MVSTFKGPGLNLSSPNAKLTKIKVKIEILSFIPKMYVLICLSIFIYIYHQNVYIYQNVTDTIFKV